MLFRLALALCALFQAQAAGLLQQHDAKSLDAQVLGVSLASLWGVVFFLTLWFPSSIVGGGGGGCFLVVLLLAVILSNKSPGPPFKPVVVCRRPRGLDGLSHHV